MRLFEIEEREQALSSIALDHAGTTRAAARGGSPSRLDDLVRDSDGAILDSHHRLHLARAHAKRMAAQDPELARLRALVYGPPPEPAQRVGEIIEGEATKVSP